MRAELALLTTHALVQEHQFVGGALDVATARILLRHAGQHPDPTPEFQQVLAIMNTAVQLSAADGHRTVRAELGRRELATAEADLPETAFSPVVRTVAEATRSVRAGLPG